MNLPMKERYSFCLFLSIASLVSAQEPALITLENVAPAKKIVADEPVRESFSAVHAARYLDGASLAWQKSSNETASLAST